MTLFEKPMGGTELMFEELKKRLSEEHRNNFSIFNYINQADFTKKTIYWNQLSYDQQAINFLTDLSYIDKIDHFVFVSHWQSEKFRQVYQIPGYKSTVIKNACLPISNRILEKKDKVRLCYTSTPWRGLSVLLESWKQLNPKNAELHVFSSCNIYGSDFAKNDDQYFELYDKAKSLDNVFYRGSIKNEDLRKELPTFDILAYPNTFEETSCIAVIEALSCGLKVVTSNLGALPETTEGWATMYNYRNNFDLHVQKFSQVLFEEIEKVEHNLEEENIIKQIQIYKPRWSWDERIKDWNKLLNELSTNLS